MKYFIDHPEAVEKYEKVATDYICDKYSWDKMTDATIELYNK